MILIFFSKKVKIEVQKVGRENEVAEQFKLI